jgi:transcriptional regulator with XRE-family HTH domain
MMRTKIYFYRVAKLIRQAELAELSGVSQSQISKYEKGEIKQPSFGKLARIADVLGVKIDDLLEAPSSKINNSENFIQKDADNLFSISSNMNANDLDEQIYFRQILADGCSKHPSYRALKRSAVRCLKCDNMFMARRLLKEIKFTDCPKIQTSTNYNLSPDFTNDGNKEDTGRLEKNISPNLRLNTWRKQKAVPQAAFASKLVVSQPTLSRILSGELKPSIAAAIKIEDYTNGVVKLTDWD